MRARNRIGASRSEPAPAGPYAIGCKGYNPGLDEPPVTGCELRAMVPAPGMKQMPDRPRYEDDFYAWTQHQAAVLRAMGVADNRFDREHVAEAIEDLGKNERDAVRSQIRRVIEHLLKLAYSPAEAPRFDCIASVLDARQTLSDKISPTLRQDAETVMDKLYADARKRADAGLRHRGEPAAAAELARICPFSLDEILLEDWYPDKATVAGREGA
jgi:hypothetical protein